MGNARFWQGSAWPGSAHLRLARKQIIPLIARPPFCLRGIRTQGRPHRAFAERPLQATGYGVAAEGGGLCASLTSNSSQAPLWPSNQWRLGAVGSAISNPSRPPDPQSKSPEYTRAFLVIVA